MVRTRSAVALILMTAISLGACGGSKAVVRLDGSPRHADVEGVVVNAGAAGMTLDGRRSFKVSDKVVSFSTYNGALVPLASTVGAYVQAGVKGKTVVWVGKIGPVTTDASGHRTVQYQGTLVKVDGSDLVFKDGTVLRLGKGLKAPANPLGPVYAVIDADKHVIQGATFSARGKK